MESLTSIFCTFVNFVLELSPNFSATVGVSMFLISTSSNKIKRSKNCEENSKETQISNSPSTPKESSTVSANNIVRRNNSVKSGSPFVHYLEG